MCKIFDSHAHYDDSAFDGDRYQLLDRLFGDNVCGIINVGCSLKSCESSLALAERYDGVYAAVGIHPEDADKLPDDYLSRIKAFAAHDKAVAIGEIGLDYYYEGYDRQAQLRVFEEQLNLAGELDLPVIIHSREACADTMELLEKYRPKGVMHCFSGSAETAESIVKLGMYVGFTGVLTFKNAKKAVAACAAVPKDRLLLETDCPYMAPTPYRGERCDSGMIMQTAAKMAEIKGTSCDEMLKICADNTKRLFGIAK